MKLYKFKSNYALLTPEVANEYGKDLQTWMKVIKVKDQQKQSEFEKMVDLGEASAIALALELPDSVLIIDDKRGRILAANLNISITGTLGTLLKAKQLNVISKVKPYLEKLKQIDYRISKEIELEVLNRAEE